NLHIPVLFDLIVFFVLVFFFFQAEDGIRDRNVTGVQTCALPIYQALVPDSLPAGAGGLTSWDKVPGPGPGDLERISGEDDHIPALATGVGDVAAQDLPAWFPACGPAQLQVHTRVTGGRGARITGNERFHVALL